MAFPHDKLAANLRRSFESALFRRGEQYFKDGHVDELIVRQLKSGSVKVKANVSGSYEYDASITFDMVKGSVVDCRCTCPYGDYCKHSVAVGLKFIAEGDKLMAKAVRLATAKEETADALARDEDYNEDEYDDEDDLISFAAKLKSIGINPDKLSTRVMEELAKSQKAVPVVKKAKLAPKPPKPVKPPLRARNLNDDYYLLFTSSYHFQRLELVSRDRYANWGYQPDQVAQVLGGHRDILTADQTALLKALQVCRYYDANQDWYGLMLLAEKSGFPIFTGTVGKKTEVVFDHAPAPLGLRLLVRDIDVGRYAASPEMLTNGFVLETTAPVEGLFLGGQAGLVHVANGNIAMHPTSELASRLIARMERRQPSLYNAMGRMLPKNTAPQLHETHLTEDEIINLNDLATGLCAIANLESDLPLPLDIKAHGKPHPCFIIDYNASTARLELTAAMDYGFDEQSVTKRWGVKYGTVERKTQYVEGRYLWRLTGASLDYAPHDDVVEKRFFEAVTNHARLGMHTRKTLSWKGPDAIAQFVANVQPLFAASGYPLKFIGDQLNFTPAAFRADLDVSFDAGSDLLAFDAACYCGEDRVTVDDLRRFVDEGEQYLRADGGRLLQITNRAELAKFVRMLESFSRKKDGEYEGHAYNAPELEEALTSPHYRAKVAASLKSFLAEAQAGRPVEPVAAPPAVAAVLRDYQKDGLDWCHFLRKYRFGGVLADDMGLGKTLQALCLVAMTRVPGRPSLVVCPKTLVLNWDDEVKKFFQGMKVVIVDGPPVERRARLATAAEADLVITSYPCLQRDAALHDARRYNYCLIDEAQFIKNHATQSARAVKAVHADYRLALTGTPLENSVSEIWSIFDFLMPGFLGRRADFVRRFETPIMKKGNAAALDELKRKVACFMLRRTKGEVLKELPPKIEQYRHAELGDQQNLLYQDNLASVRRDVFSTVEKQGFAKSQIHVLAGLTKLRQVCNHPNLLLKEKKYDKYESAKLESFLEIIDEIVAAKRQVLVFSQFTTMLDILAAELKKRDVSYLYLSGKTKNRKELVDKFNHDPAHSVFLISLKAGGTGLNLTAADNVIIFDPWWNPSVENQAVDRAHRIGQRNSVNVYRLITKGTIEEKIVKLQDRKRHLFDSLVGESQDLFEKLTWDEVKELFR